MVMNTSIDAETGQISKHVKNAHGTDEGSYSPGFISTVLPRLSIFNRELDIIQRLAVVTEDECVRHAEIAAFKK